MSETRPKTNLGDEVKDSVTGFRGIAAAQTLFLNGCWRIGVQAKMGADGKVPDMVWFDDPQLIVTKPKKSKEGSRETGGPMLSIPRRQDCPKR